jgi:hypothetical protein
MSALALSGHFEDARECPLSGESGHAFLRYTRLLLTPSGHRFGIGHFSSHDPVTDKRSHGTGADPES